MRTLVPAINLITTRPTLLINMMISYRAPISKNEVTITYSFYVQFDEGLFANFVHLYESLQPFYQLIEAGDIFIEQIDPYRVHSAHCVDRIRFLKIPISHQRSVI